MATDEQNKLWPKMALGVGGASLLLVGLVFVFVGLSDEDPTVGPSPSPTVEHAPWRVRVFTAGSRGAPSRAQRRDTQEHAPSIAAAVERIYDALLLGTAKISDLGRDVLSPDAAKALGSSRLGLPADTDEVIAVRRRAEIGVDAHRARRAAVRVTYTVEGMRRGSEVRVTHLSDMWLERTSDGWRAVAFDGTRRGR